MSRWYTCNGIPVEEEVEYHGKVRASTLRVATLKPKNFEIFVSNWMEEDSCRFHISEYFEHHTVSLFIFKRKNVFPLISSEIKKWSGKVLEIISEKNIYEIV